MRGCRTILAAMALLALPAKAEAAEPLPATGTFLYSNACASPGGDFSGYRVTLVRSAKSLRAKIEFNDDGPDGSDTARNVRFNPASGALSFSFRGSVDADSYTFHGMVTGEKLVGTFDVKLAGRRETHKGELQTLPAVEVAPKYLPPCDPRFPP